MRKIFISGTVLAVVMLLLPASTLAQSNINISFRSIGSYDKDVDNDGVNEKIWVVPLGENWKVDAEKTSVDLNKYIVKYNNVEILEEPGMVNGVLVNNLKSSIKLLADARLVNNVFTASVVSDNTLNGAVNYAFQSYSKRFEQGININGSELSKALADGNLQLLANENLSITELEIVNKEDSGDKSSWYFNVVEFDKAVLSENQVEICGEDYDFQAYNINGYTYFKLRDIAAAFANTEYAFNVVWDGQNNKIKITTGEKSTDTILNSNVNGSIKTAYLSNDTNISLDGKTRFVGAYKIDGSNYYSLRDISELTGFNVTWNEKEHKIICR